eukprot:333684_1
MLGQKKKNSSFEGAKTFSIQHSMSNSKKRNLSETNDDIQESPKKKQKLSERNDNQETKSNHDDTSETKEETRKINVIVNGTSELFTTDNLLAIQALRSTIQHMIKTNTDQPLQLEDMRFKMNDFKEALKIINNNCIIPSTLNPQNIIGVFNCLDFFRIEISLINFKNYYNDLQDTITTKYDKLWSTAKLNGYDELLCSLMYELKNNKKSPKDTCSECGQQYITICNWGCNAHSSTDVGMAYVAKYRSVCEICYRCDQSKDHVQYCKTHQHNFVDDMQDAPDAY